MVLSVKVPVAVDVPRPGTGNGGGVMDIFIEPGPGLPVVKLAVHDGNFNGWVDLTPQQAVNTAIKLLEAAMNQLSVPHGYNVPVGSPYHPIKPASVEPSKRKRGRPPSQRGPISRLDATAAGGVDDVSGRVGQARKGNSGTVESERS
jgi:hypothetical protein